MKLTITIDTENDAFQGDLLSYEIARILQDYAMKLEHGEIELLHYRLHDINGNAVGEAVLK